MKSIHHIVLLSLLIMASCSEKKVEEKTEAKEETKTWQQEFIDQKLGIVGTEIDKKLKEEKYLFVETDSLEHYYYKAVAYKDQGYAGSMDIDFFFADDKICKQGYEDFKASFDKHFGESSPSATMASWKAPSSRDKVVTVMLVDRSSFYQQPRLQIKLKENDNLQYKR